MIYPIEIKLIDSYLKILWIDSIEQKIKLANLRYYCPCAICQKERIENSNSYIPIYSDDQITVEKIRIVGNYAINIIWKDNHDTGIYNFELLRNIS